MTPVGSVVRLKADQGREWQDGVEPRSMSREDSDEALGDVETDDGAVQRWRYLRTITSRLCGRERELFQVIPRPPGPHLPVQALPSPHFAPRTALPHAVLDPGDLPLLALPTLSSFETAMVSILRLF